MPSNDRPATIEEIQAEFRAAGYQWVERVFSDGYSDDCLIFFTKDKDPESFTKKPCGDCGWGRYPRSRCWQKAHEWLKGATHARPT